MKKRLELIINDTCEDCPYCHYNSYVSMSYDSGYDCGHPTVIKHYRIIDDYYLNKNGWPPIPPFCPLPDVKE